MQARTTMIPYWVSSGQVLPVPIPADTINVDAMIGLGGRLVPAFTAMQAPLSGSCLRYWLWKIIFFSSLAVALSSLLPWLMGLDS